MPAAVINYLQAETREKIQRLNEILVEKDWLAIEDNRVIKIHKKLSKADWLDEDDEIEAMR